MRGIVLYSFLPLSSLSDPMRARRDKLESALLLQQFYRDVEDEVITSLYI